MTNKELFKTKKLEDGRISEILIAPTIDGKEVITVSNSTNGKSALRAASSLFRMGDYENDLTQVNFHAYSKYSTMLPYMERFAIVKVDSYKGDLIPAELLEKEAENHPLKWAQVDILNGNAKLSTIHPWGNPDKIEDEDDRKEWYRKMKLAQLRAMKHDWVDVLLQGYGLRIQCLPWSKYAEVILEGVYEKSDKKAEAHRIEGYARRDARVTMFGKTNPTMKDPERRSDASSIEVSLISGETVPISELEYGRYNPMYGSRKFGTIRWDGSAVALNALLQAVDQDWDLEFVRAL